MKIGLSAVVPVTLCLSALTACSSGAPQSDDSTSSVSEAVTSCPAPPWDDAQQRALATLALNLMRQAGSAAGTTRNAIQAYSVLATQRYRFRSPGPGIEFDPADPLYSYVTDPMKAELAFAQLDSSVAAELGDSLWNNWQQTDGEVFASIASVQNIGAFKAPSPYTAPVLDHTSGRDMATVTRTTWCGSALINVAETCKDSSNFAPMIAHDISEWRSSPPSGFVGKAHIPSTVFNGDLAGGNPYLVVSLNGVSTTWTNYNFAGADCTKLPNSTCTGTLQLDPVPYAEPGAYYDISSNLVGPQPNPFATIGTMLYADPSHQDDWATRTINGTQEWGQFSRPVTLYGMTKYAYVKVY